MQEVWVFLCLLAVAGGSPAGAGGIDYPTLAFHEHKNGDTGTQLQPEGHNNFVHGVPNFFEHEIIYVEDDAVLVWHPSSGKWALHSLQRSCGADCPVIMEQPMSSGVWEDLQFHKLVFLGCHAATGAGHLLAIDAASGNYSIHRFHHANPEPLQGELAAFVRLEMSQFRVSYMGRDEVLLFDPNTDEYRIYLVDPMLPVSKGTDPIGPFDPLDQGTYGLKEQIIYLGNNHVMDYSSTTGVYTVFSYDRGASGTERPFTHRLADGQIETGLQLTYLAEHQMLAFDPETARFKVFDIYEDGGFVSNPVNFYGFGSLGVGCWGEKSCSTCLARDGCGWCDTNQECFRGAFDGPCGTNCTNWEMHLCPGEPCESHRGCTACLRDPFCGWCADVELCTEGTTDGPLFGSCEYHKMDCPSQISVGESGCESQIQ